MPQLSDLLEKKKFIKKSYRPWDLSGTGTIDNASHQTLIIPSQDINEQEHETKIIIPNQQDKIDVVANPDSIANVTAIVTDNETGNKIADKEVTTKRHSNNNQVTGVKQLDNQLITKKKHQSNIWDNKRDNNFDIYYLVETIKKLSGIQKNIFLYIINTCTARGVLDTGNILSMELANAGKCSIESAKTSLNRLIEKHLVIRHPGKACRGGHMVLGITNEIQSAAIQAQQALFNPLKMNYLSDFTGNNIGNKIDNNHPYSSSYNNKNNTTNISEEWKNVKFDALQGIGFSDTQIMQLANSQMTTPEIVQSSINHFAFALANKDKVKAYTDPLNVLMGVLRKGQNWHETDYISPQELSLQRILNERKKRKERVDAIIKELSDLEFPNWRKNLTQDEIKIIVPEDILKTNLAPAISATLRSYFIEKILMPRLEQEAVLEF